MNFGFVTYINDISHAQFQSQYFPFISMNIMKILLTLITGVLWDITRLGSYYTYNIYRKTIKFLLELRSQFFFKAYKWNFSKQNSREQLINTYGVQCVCWGIEYIWIKCRHIHINKNAEIILSLKTSNTETGHKAVTQLFTVKRCTVWKQLN